MARLRAYLINKRKLQEEEAVRLPPIQRKPRKKPETGENSVRGKRRARKLERSAKDKEIAELIVGGAPTILIKQRLNVSDDVIHRVAKEMGLKPVRFNAARRIQLPLLPLDHPLAPSVYADMHEGKTKYTTRGTVRCGKGGPQAKHTERILEAGRKYPRMSYSDIARMLGVSKFIVHTTLVPNGLARIADKKPNENFALCDVEWAKGEHMHKNRALREATGLSKATISRYLVHKRKQLDAQNAKA